MDDKSRKYCLSHGGKVWWIDQDCYENMCEGACCLQDGCLPDKTYGQCIAEEDALSWGLQGDCDECPDPPEDDYYYGFRIWLGNDGDPVNTATGNFLPQRNRFINCDPRQATGIHPVLQQS